TPTHHAAPQHGTPTEAPAVTPAISTVTPGATTIARYGIFEQDFSHDSAALTNPWEQVRVTMTLAAPSGKQITIGGFYYGLNTWKARFSPAEPGNWTWSTELTDGGQTTRSQGRFTVTDSACPGFVRINPANKFRWIFDNGAPYYPLGVGDCILDKNNSNSILDDWGFDGGFRDSSVPEYGWVTDIDTYLRAYGDAGVNLF